MSKNFRRNLKCFFACCLTVLLSSCASLPTVQSKAIASRLGESKQTAVEVCMPAGERAYISRLVCSNNQSPSFKRLGNVGERNSIPKDLSLEQEKVLLEKLINRTPLQPGEPDYHIIDAYELVCGEEKRVIYLDMYHCNQPTPAEAIRGFTIRALP